MVKHLSPDFEVCHGHKLNYSPSFYFCVGKDHGMKSDTRAMHVSYICSWLNCLLKIACLLWNKSSLTLAVEIGLRNKV